VRTYDFEADKELEVIATSRERITTIDWAQERNWLAIGTATGTIELWDITTKTLLSELRGHLHGVTRVAILPDGSRLVSASRDGTVKIWNLERTPPLPVLHLGPHLERLSIDRHNRVAVVCRRGHVELVEIASRKRRLILQKGFNDINAVFCPADDILAMSTGDGTVSLWRVPSFEGDLPQTAIEIGNQGLHLAFSPDGSLLVCGGHEQQVIVYDVTAGRILRKLSLGGAGDVSDLSFVGSTNRLAVAVTDLRVVIVDPTTDERIREIRTNTPNAFIDVSRDGQLLAVGDGKAPLSLWNITTGEQLKSIENATGIQDVTLSPDGQLLATAGQDFHVRLWDVATGEQRAILRGHPSHVNQVAFSSHGDCLISTGAGDLLLWQATTPREAEAAEGSAKYASRLRAQGESAAAAAILKSNLETRSAAPDLLWDEWFEVNAIDLRRSVREILADWPRTRNEAPSRGTDMREVLGQLESKGIIRINCGGDDYRTADGTLWSRDCCWVDGEQAETERPVEQTEDDRLYHSERWFHATSKPFGYSIALPPGRYKVTLHFAEMVDRKSIAERRFDVLVEGKEVLKNYQPPLFTADSISITVKVNDGFLNVRFRHRMENPKISAIEICTSD
jgi:WD40 repeat protein